MTYEAPNSIWEVGPSIRFDEPLESDDPRFVDTSRARGPEFNYNALLKPLGINPKNWELMVEPEQQRYMLFCGHRGCGKSTELRRIARHLNDPERFFVVSLDALVSLDINNLQYTDILLALARRLLERLEQAEVVVDPVFTHNLENWFVERIERHDKTKEFAAEAKAGIKAEGGIPLLAKLFTEITTAVRTNSTYKEELRKVTKNHFSQFADAFNQLIRAARDAVKRQGLGQAILFVVDGADRLNQEDSHRFFIADAYQLQTIQGLFIYCAPIHLIYEHGQINQIFPHSFKLPMVKLNERDGSRVKRGYRTLRELIYRRAHPDLFESEASLDRLIQHSGGHPRDLLRLLGYAFNAADGERFDAVAIDKAIKQLATDYRRLLDAEDYPRLVTIDTHPDEDHNDERSRKLLYDLALLEYNSYWWQSHPTIRTLPGYLKAAEGSTQA